MRGAHVVISIVSRQGHAPFGKSRHGVSGASQTNLLHLLPPVPSLSSAPTAQFAMSEIHDAYDTILILDFGSQVITSRRTGEHQLTDLLLV